jgi:hypothetical protein
MLAGPIRLAGDASSRSGNPKRTARIGSITTSSPTCQQASCRNIRISHFTPRSQRRPPQAIAMRNLASRFLASATALTASCHPLATVGPGGRRRAARRPGLPGRAPGLRRWPRRRCRRSPARPPAPGYARRPRIPVGLRPGACHRSRTRKTAQRAGLVRHRLLRPPGGGRAALLGEAENIGRELSFTRRKDAERVAEQITTLGVARAVAGRMFGSTGRQVWRG